MDRAKKNSESDDGTPEQMDHPWNTLTTITTFDQGDNMKSTFRLNDNDEDQSNGKITLPSRLRQPQATQSTVLIESLLQQLCNILEADKVRSKKLYHAICKKLNELQLINDTYDLMEFETLRGRYQHAFYQMLSVACNKSEKENVLFIPKFLMPKLRYHKEFHEISFIASGGFGKVYKARHRLDGIEYAIKKITMPIDRIDFVQTQLNEVRTLAKLNHTNIVSYNAAWIESYNSDMPSTDHEPYTSKHHRRVSKSYNSLIEDLFNKNDIKTKKQNEMYGNSDNGINYDTISKRFEELDSSVYIVDIKKEKIIEESNKEDNNIDESNSDDSVSFRNSKSNENLDVTITDSNSDSSSNSSSSYDESSKQEVCMYKNRPHVTLYIQMALCEQTLEQWLCGKISATPEPMSRAIFQQILCGVDYMHSQKIVHHDIKPSNIFISTSGRLQIQLGDFGLACPLQIGNQHSVVGTRMYAAPEQLQGKCDSKSDIYSIGIVLIELLILIKTQMELSYIINCLKSGEIPEALKQHKWAQMVKQLVQDDPIERPSTSQLLQKFNDDKDVVINGLKDTIVNLKNDNRVKDNTIQELQELHRVKDNTIQELQEEMALLKEKVQELSIQKIDNMTS